MSSDTINSRGKQVDLIALVVGIVGIVIALFGFKQGWDAGEVRPIMSWLIALSFWLSIAIGMLFSCADLVCFPCSLADDYSSPM